MLLIACYLLFFCLLPDAALAQAGGGAATLADSCTDQPVLKHDFAERIKSMLQEIITLLDNSLQDVAQRLFEGIVASPNYTLAIGAAMTLYLIFYAAAFVFGIVPATFGQALIRISKIGLLAIILSPEGWQIFSDTVGGVFDDGINYLINLVVAIGNGSTSPDCPVFDQFTGTVVNADVATPFCILDNVMQLIFSPKFLIVILASFTTGPYGVAMGGALAISLILFIMTVVKAMVIYAMYLVVKTLLFGLAPIFFGLFLFDRTKNVFIGWVNQLASVSLQALFMFAFLSFFVVLIQTAAEDMIGKVELCYTKYERAGETHYDQHGWRFKINGEIYEGDFPWQGDHVSNKPFPISMLNLLIFMILMYLAYQMTEVVVLLASEIAQSILKLDQIPGAVNQWFSGMQGKGLDPRETISRFKPPGTT